MDYDACRRKIDRYLRRENDTQPLLVDVQNWQDMERLFSHYAVGNIKQCQLSSYCKKDEFPRLEDFFADLQQIKTDCIVTELASFLCLLGEQSLKNKLNELLHMSLPAHVIVLTYQCTRYLRALYAENFHRNSQIHSHIVALDGDKEPIPRICFCTPEFPLPDDIVQADGLENLPALIRHTDMNRVYLHTRQRKSQYNSALYAITEIRNAYDILVLKDSATKNLAKTWGEDEQWQYALQQFDRYNCWYDLINNEIGDPNRLDIYLAGLQSLSDNQLSQNKKWLYFIAFKLYGSKNNPYLNEAVQNSSSPAELIKHLYDDILDKDVKDKDYWQCYENRKRVLRQLKLKNTPAELREYCKLVRNKERNAIFYLTDISSLEEKELFACLDIYGLDYKREKLLQTLQIIYPDLYTYLQPYDFKNQLLNQYFQDYKYQKVTNKLLPEFYDTVLDQARKREYNLILEPRSANIENLAGSKNKLFFVDAMGVEYLSYIKSICQKFHLAINIKVCRAELPTITDFNKEFEAEWTVNNYPKTSEDKLDKLKHQYNETKDDERYAKLPVYLTRELEIIYNVLDKIQSELANGDIDKAIMIADHGATRLAVLYDKENTWEMSQKGEHSGRCCLKSDVDEQPEFAVDAGDYWALANYDRFKGGRKIGVELHGGATLEEVCVPIITIQRMKDREIDVLLKPIVGGDFKKTATIKVSFRKKAAILMFISEELPDVHVCVQEKQLQYDAVKAENQPNCYRVDMPDLKKAGTYHLNVFSGENQIAKDLPLIIVKEGQQERNLL